MTGLQAVVLGLVQGFGEFLPISSSGHLIVVPWLLGWPPQGLSFDVGLHLGTLFAVVGAFARDWVRLLGSAIAGLRERQPFAAADSRLLWLILLASLPGGIAGMLLEHKAETAFRSPLLVAVAMAVLGGVLFLADRFGSGRADIGTLSMRDALIIGLAQAAALVPGVSRSGATISMALFLGYRRGEAARFSFLLATPITLGAVALKVPGLLRSEIASVALIGMVAAAASGFLSIRWLLGYVKTRDYRPFVWYRLALAAVVIAVFLARAGH